MQAAFHGQTYAHPSPPNQTAIVTQRQWVATPTGLARLALWIWQVMQKNGFTIGTTLNTLEKQKEPKILKAPQEETTKLLKVDRMVRTPIMYASQRASTALGIQRQSSKASGVRRISRNQT